MQTKTENAVGEVFELPGVCIYLDRHGHIWHKFEDKANVTIGLAKMMTEVYEKISNGEKLAVIIDTRNKRVSATLAAMRYLAQNEKATKWRKADTILVNSLHVRLLANFYFSVIDRSHPARSFWDEKEALKWLKKFD